MKTVYLLFALGISYVRSEVINLNELVDKNLFRVQNFVRHFEFISRGLFFKDFPVSDKFTFNRGTVFGVDYVRRTGDCKLIKEEGNYTYEFNIGSDFLVVVAPSIKYNDEEMSAIFHVRNNSLYSSFNQFQNGGIWTVTVNDLRIKSLGQVEVWSSNPKYEGSDVDDIFEDIREQFNKKVSDKNSGFVVGELWLSTSSGYSNGLFNEL